MSSCAIEPFCHGVEGQILIHLWGIALHRAFELGLFQSHAWRAQHQLQRWEKEPNSSNATYQPAQREAAAQEGPTLSTADAQASCKAPICRRDAAPRAPRRWLPGNTAASHPPCPPCRGVDASLAAAATARERIWFWTRVGGRWPEMKGIYISPTP